jgi:hypothetical protein
LRPPKTVIPPAAPAAEENRQVKGPKSEEFAILE